jgi:hypothetical protein
VSLLGSCVRNFVTFSCSSKSRDSVVGKVNGYGLDDQKVGVRVPRYGQEFLLLHLVQTGSGVDPTSSYTMGTGGSFPGVKRPGREAEHSPPTSTEVKKTWIYTFTPHTPSWRSAHLVKAQGPPFFFLSCSSSQIRVSH